MDLTWLFLILCPYMLLYFYFSDVTHWAKWKITVSWLLGLIIIIAGWFLINYFIPDPLPFPAPLFKAA